MRKRGYRLLALGLAALLAFQTPVTVAAENEVQTETVAEEGQETQQVQETEPPSEEQEICQRDRHRRIQNTQKIIRKTKTGNRHHTPGNTPPILDGSYGLWMKTTRKVCAARVSMHWKMEFIT